MNSDNRNEEEYKIRKTYYALPDAPEYTYCAWSKETYYF